MGAAMTAPTCPHCGAERSARKSVAEFECRTVCFFECGTVCSKDGTYVRDWGCYERQLAQQAAEIERLKADNKHLKVSLHKLELLVEHRRQSRGEVK